jgi:hydrophobe/amphiphile efflux-3 (HAE3) family protein
MAMQMKNAKFNPDMMTYLPEDMPSRVNQKTIEDIFGGTQMVMIVIQTDDVINAKTLKRIRTFSHKMKKIKGIEKVMSLFDLKQVRNEDDAMIVDPSVKMIPRSKEDIEIIKKEIVENDLVYGSVISKDFSTTAVIGMMKPDAADKPVVMQLEKLIKDIPGNEKVLLGGSPYMRTQTAANMQRDISRLLPIGILFMLIFLFISFRQFRGVWLPTVVVIMSILVSLGFIPLFNWDFTVVTIILPVLLIAVANDYGIHMFTHYQDDNFVGNTYSKKEISRRMVTGLGSPIMIAGFTTIVGLLCMLGHILIPAGQMGILGGLGIGFALAASLLFVPALSSFLPKTKPILVEEHHKDAKGLNKMLSGISYLTTEKPRLVIWTLVAVSLLVSIGIFNLTVNTNTADLYPEGHPVKTSAELINSELGGFMPLSIVFEGDIKEPRLLKKIDRLEKRIQKIPEVGTTQSIAKVTRQISRALNAEEEPNYDHIPDTYNAVAQYFELYLMSGDPDDLEKMVDFSFQRAMILLRFNDLDTPVMRKCVQQIKDMVKDDPDVKYVGGNADVFSEMDKQIVYGQFKSLALSLVAVFLILSIVFRSLKGALLQIIPLVLAMMILFGIMGIVNIELNFTTALISSIMIGVGIDYTIHLVWRYREERKAGLDAAEGMKVTLHTTGRGIVFNAFSVIVGFAALLFSSFLPVRFFGLLMVIIILACLIGGLLLVPSICLALRPKFLEPEAGEEITSDFSSTSIEISEKRESIESA